MKKFIMQKLIICSLLAVLFSGCGDDFLDLKPVSNLTMDQFYKNGSDYETAIMGVYYNFAEWVLRPRMMSEYRSDNIKFWRLIYGEFSNNTLSSNTTEIIWGQIYKTLVNPSNNIINTIDVIVMDEAKRKQIKGEALFFRGFAYYWLNLCFEGVPIVLRPLSIEESYQLGRSTEAETWAQAEADFAAAFLLLPDMAPEYGRVDKYVAETFLAKTHMQQQKWGLAKNALSDVFTNSGHSLQPVWADMWTRNGQKLSPELMCVGSWSPTIKDDDMGQFLNITNQVVGFFEFEPGLLASFDVQDKRKNETLGFDGVYRNFKYDFGWDNSIKLWTGDVVVLRFTDVQLLYAEAITMSAGSVQQQSLDLMNQTRNRAGLSNLSIADISTTAKFVDAILAERRAEFVFECERYPDLKRHNKLVSNLNAIGYTYTENYKRMPIPASEIDKMQGVLIQNPGY